MHDLTIIKKNSGAYIDSREVAEVIGKRHDHLLRDIRGYIQIIENGGLPKVGASDFFVPSSYQSEQNKEMPCYLLSKMGCEMVANKLTGEKGVLFTAMYVAKFNAMEAAERDSQKSLQAPRLGEYNAAARIIVRALNGVGATSRQIMGFLKSLYEPLGLTIAHAIPEAEAYDEAEEIPLWYTAREIAEIQGVYSLNGKPHSQAIAAIINEHLFVGGEHKAALLLDCGECSGMNVRYDDFTLEAVGDWIVENGCPSKIYGNGRTYHVLYDFQM